jgi:polar amino acid transport system substrate-binding protein
MQARLYARGVPRRRSRRLAATLVTAVVAVAAVGYGTSGATTPPHSAAAGVDAAARALLPASIRSSGVLRDGINSPNLPMEFPGPANKGFQGFDISLAKAIGAKLGVKVAFDNVAFVQLIPSLGTGRIDIMLSALSDLATRRATATWIDYFKSGARMFTTKANASKYPTLTSLCGQTIETAVGTSYIQEIPTLSATTCKGKAPMKVLAVGGSLAEEELTVKTGRAAAAVSAPENFSSLPSSYVPVGGIWAPSHYGIAVKAGNTPVINAVKAAFTDLLKNGTYAKIAKKWGQTASEVTTVTVNGK